MLLVGVSAICRHLGTVGLSGTVALGIVWYLSAVGSGASQGHISLVGGAVDNAVVGSWVVGVLHTNIFAEIVLSPVEYDCAIDHWENEEESVGEVLSVKLFYTVDAKVLNLQHDHGNDDSDGTGRAIIPGND
jgi:hypothetical protein